MLLYIIGIALFSHSWKKANIFTHIHKFCSAAGETICSVGLDNEITFLVALHKMSGHLVVQ